MEQATQSRLKQHANRIIRNINHLYQDFQLANILMYRQYMIELIQRCMPQN
jgi:hypothetical protein